MQVPAQRRGLHETLISLETSSDVPAIFSGMGRGSTQEPQSRFSFFRITQYHSIQFFVPVRFSQSDLLPTSSDGTVASLFGHSWLIELHQNSLLSKDVESLLRIDFHVGSSQSLLSDLNEVFLHVRCIPHQ